MLALTILLFIGLTNGAVQVSKFYNSDLACTLSPTAMFVTQQASCTPAACSNLNSKAGSSIECPATVSYPAGWVRIETWAASSTCSGLPDGILATPNNTCSGYWTSSTVTLSCATSTISDCGASTQVCSGCASKAADKSGNCVTGNPTSSFIISSYKFVCSTSSAWTLIPAFALVLATILFV